MDQSSTLIQPNGTRATNDSRAELRRRVREAFARRRRLWILLCAVLVVLVAVRASWSGARGPSLEAALVEVLASGGVRVDPSTVSWLRDNEGPLHMRPAVFLGRRDGELNDLYYAEVRPGGEGTALDVAWLSNLSHTGSADEEQLVRSGDHLAYATRVGDAYDAIVILDLRGESETLTEGWPARARVQARITNLQETGRAEGFGARRYQLVSPAPSLRLEADDVGFVAHVGDEELRLDPDREAPTEGAALVEVEPQTKGMPGTVTWLVDTVRALSWVGPEPIEWLENRVFAIKDGLTRGYHGVFGEPDAQETADEVAEDLTFSETLDEERIAMLTVTDPELGWPPAALEPIITEPAIEGEGRWLPIVDDPYVNSYPNAPPAFFQTFVRADPERAYNRVYVTIWDPRQIQMRIQSGVYEPESATGQRGTGMIPRDDRTLRRLVGALNGGFQALHGEFGMMADGRVYLPPKPWAATVAVYDDGRVGMGSWPAPDWRGRFYDEQLANRQIPSDVVDMRQNLTSVVEDGRYNPWERWYWGAAPRSVEEQTFTTRSALCLTEDRFLAYFWSQGIGPEALGQSMLRAHCVRAIHLDMNNPHCGMELFRPIAPGEEVPPLPRRPRAGSEFEGPFERTVGHWRLRARRAVRSMGMPFPRYSGRDGRDFFYLTLRPILPGPHAPIEGGAEGEGIFSTEGLPHAGWPHAFARAFYGGDEERRTWVVRIDPRRAVPAPLRRSDEGALASDQRRPLAYLTDAASLSRGDAPFAIFGRRSAVGWDLAIGRPSSEDRVVLSGPPLSELPDAGAAVGVDADGFLVYAERGDDPTPLSERLAAVGVTEAMALPDESRLAFAVGDANAGPDGFTARTVVSGTALAFLAEERPAAELMFPDNEPQPYRVWGQLQDQRVRYFSERDEAARPRFVRPPEAPTDPGEEP